MAAINPFAYYNMNDLNVDTTTFRDSVGTYDMVGTGTAYLEYNEFGNRVLRLSSTTNSFVATTTTQNFVNSFSIEFQMRITNHFFNGGQIFSTDDGAVSIYFTSYVSSSVPTLFLRTLHPGNNEQTTAFSFNGIERGRENFGYFLDGRTHHLVFTYDSITGIKKLYIDGYNPGNFSGNSNHTGNLYAPGTNHSLRIHSNTDYRKFLVDINNIALYNDVITDNQIQQHYSETSTGTEYYTFTELDDIATYEDLVPGYSMLDFAPGTDLYTNGLTQGVSIDQLKQLQKFPIPRYKSGHTLNRLFNWFTVDFIAQSGGNVVGANAALVAFSKSIITEYFTNWNYYLPVSHQQDITPAGLINQTTNYTGMLVKLANDNPTIPTQYITLRIQLNNNAPKLTDKTLASNYYFQNSGGEFLDRNGTVTVVSGNKVWRPVASTLSVYRSDGILAKTNVDLLLNALSGRSTPRINIINENAEIIPMLSESNLGLDPLFVSEKTSAGAPSNQRFFAINYKKLMRDNYADIFMTASTLSGAVYTEYTLEGATDGSDISMNKPWEEVRQINTQINGQYYSTGDFYTRYPYNWRGWISAWHGLQWFIQGRKTEIDLGDNLFSPFISAGWDKDERNNVRPAQWLGLLKILSVMGAEFFYTGIFNESAPYPDPKNYIWQTVTPAYAQALTSRFEDILRNGQLLEGDYPRSYDPPQTNGPGYHFYTGDLRKFCVVRKHETKGEFIIGATLNPVNNYSGGVEDSSKATIYLDGINPLTFNVRRQGSVFFYQSGATPIFYQLDGWHENTHPYYWSSDIAISAPLYDSAQYVPIKTERTGGTYDFTAFTSYVSFSSATNVQYIASPRSAVTHYFWIKARSSDGTSAGMTVSANNGTTYPIGCIKSTEWNWYRRQSTGTTEISFALSAGTNILNISSTNNKLEISDIYLTPSSADIFPEGTASAYGIPPIVVSSGGTVVLSAASGSSYFWYPTSATTQVVTAVTSGTYYVKIDDGAGCTATTNSIEVVVTNDEFLVNINAFGATSFSPGGSVVLTASTLYYLTGATSFNFQWYSASTLLNPYTTSTSMTGSSFTAVATGYYYAIGTSTATTNSLSSTTIIYINANVAGPGGGTTTESLVDFPLTYANNIIELPQETNNFTLLDATINIYYIFVKIRSRTGRPTGVKISLDDWVNFISITDISNTTLGWYRIGVLRAGFRDNLLDYNPIRTIRFQANNNALEMEKYAVSKFSTFIPGPFPNTNF